MLYTALNQRLSMAGKRHRVLMEKQMKPIHVVAVAAASLALGIGVGYAGKQGPTLLELNAKWRHQGVEHPFQVRMGANSGFCNVGNFGSEDRMQYTIIGAEANLAARLQAIAEPGQIVVSYETYSAVRDMASARALAPIRVKGVSREIVPYVVKGPLDAEAGAEQIFSEHGEGVDFYLDPDAVGKEALPRLREILRRALSALERPGPEAG